MPPWMLLNMLHIMVIGWDPLPMVYRLAKVCLPHMSLNVASTSATKASQTTESSSY